MLFPRRKELASLKRVIQYIATSLFVQSAIYYIVLYAL